MQFSVGLGLTNACNLECAHCYRPRGQIYNLTLSQVQLICDAVDVKSVGLGTGENGLNPEFFEIIGFLRGRRIPVTLASNGYTVQNTPDEILASFREIEFSIDFPEEKEQDAFRGQGNWRRILSGIERCRRVGVAVSILAVLMNINHAQLGKLAKTAASFGCNLRVNLFQPVQSGAYLPSYRQFWEAFRILFDSAAVLSCSEPLVNTFCGMNTRHGSPCGRSSIRITPLGEVLPCVYWPLRTVGLKELVLSGEDPRDSASFREAQRIPEACLACEFVENCRGGCRSRAWLLDRKDLPDIYCPKLNGEDFRLAPCISSADPLLRAGSICTTIVRG
ncbi:MAG: radical SAM protein [Desulfobacteraceae bacterium]|nr:MAG: radical SAM protein [Desulfobacteraceae bacterium]